MTAQCLNTSNKMDLKILMRRQRWLIMSKSVSSDTEGGAHTLSGQNGDLTGKKLTIVQIIH